MCSVQAVNPAEGGGGGGMMNQNYVPGSGRQNGLRTPMQNRPPQYKQVSWNIQCQS